MLTSEAHKTYLFLVVFDSQFQPGEIIITLILQEIHIIPEVQNQFELSGAARLVKQIFGELLALLGKLFILWLEFILHLTELLELPAELEGRQEGVFAGEGDERGTGQGTVNVETGSGMSQAVHVWARHAFHAVAAHLVRLGYGHTLLNQHLNDLIVVGMSGQDDRRYVRGKIGELFIQQDRRHLEKREIRVDKVHSQLFCIFALFSGINVLKTRYICLKMYN